MEPISQRGRALRDINPLLSKNSDVEPFESTLDILSMVYVYWMKKRDNMKRSDYKNRVLASGVNAGIRSAFSLILELQQNFQSEGKRSKNYSRKS